MNLLILCYKIGMSKIDGESWADLKNKMISWGQNLIAFSIFGAFFVLLALCAKWIMDYAEEITGSSFTGYVAATLFVMLILMGGPILYRFWIDKLEEGETSRKLRFQAKLVNQIADDLEEESKNAEALESFLKNENSLDRKMGDKQ